MASRRHRLARLGGGQSQREAGLDMLAGCHRDRARSVMYAKIIRRGLIRLGVEPARATAIAKIDRAEAALAELPPLPPGYVHRPRPIRADDRPGPDLVRRWADRYRDPAAPPPDPTLAPSGEWLIYVLLRAPWTEADLAGGFRDEPCDTVSIPHGLTPADGKEDSTGPD